MTGTGTQADPYMVSTMGEFLTAVGTAESYVKLANDIDVSTDETYKNGVNSTINVYSVDIDGGGHTISGLIVKSAVAWDFTRAALVRDLTIKNMMHNCTGSGKLINCVAASGNYASFQNVVISVRMNCNNVSFAQFCKNGHWNNCAITFMPINSKVPTNNADSLFVFDFTKATECAIRYDCDKLHFGNYGGFRIVSNAEKSYIFGKIKSLQTKYASPLFMACSGCASYLEIVGTNSASTAALTTNSDAGTNIIVTDTSTGVDFGSIPSTSKCLTSTQAKNEDYLNSIGFLP